jgi:3-dehydroquinate dehydratase
MRLPFLDGNEFVRLPGTKPACYGVFKAEELNSLLEKKEQKVLGTAARFLQVQHTQIIQVIPMSAYSVSVFFGEKEADMYDYGDED